MADLGSIPGIEKSSLELLEAAGFQNAESLAMAGMTELADELNRANSILKIARHTPGQEDVNQWILAARELVGVTQEPAGPALMPVNYEQSPQVIAMLVTAPFAIPLPARTLIENQLGVADVPAAILLNRYSGDLDVKVEQRLPGSRQPKPAANAGSYVRLADAAAPRLEMDTSRIRSTDEVGEFVPRLAPANPSPADDRVALIRAPRTATNRGRNPRSRWYIRGVLHSHPLSVFFGAIITLLFMIMVPLSLISATLLLASAERPDHFSWVPKALLAFPVALPVLGIAYLIVGLSGSCRICGQKLFVHRPHFKNTKAHYVRGLGYILPLCVQILCFRWFRCTHCGTPIRLKE